MGDIIHNISRVDQAVCWPDFTAPYSTKPSAELSSRFRLTLSCCSTTSTVDEVQRYARAMQLIYALVHVMLSSLLWVGAVSKEHRLSTHVVVYSNCTVHACTCACAVRYMRLRVRSRPSVTQVYTLVHRPLFGVGGSSQFFYNHPRRLVIIKTIHRGLPPPPPPPPQRA